MTALDLSSLTPAERRVLILLAEGHTAKSIAAEIGLSVNAVNERLREARRKVGVASSRELARALAAQESWDKQIGMAPASLEAAMLPPVGDASSGRRRLSKELVTMTVAALALTAALLAAQQKDLASVPSLYADPVQPAPTPATLHRELGAQSTDRAWAPAAERQLTDTYLTVVGVRKVKVTCKSSLCEVTGAIVPDQAPTTVEVLQTEPLLRSVRKRGFSDMPTFGVETSKDDSVDFVAYWRRSDH